jgi:hypothetical protein
MEESEIDEWFTAQKEKLEERFFATFQKNAEQAKLEFDVAYKKLILEFQKRHNDLYSKQLRDAKMRAPIERLKEGVRLRKEAVRTWYKEKVMAFKKWRFDKKIKKILQDKSDL